MLVFTRHPRGAYEIFGLNISINSGERAGIALHHLLVRGFFIGSEYENFSIRPGEPFGNSSEEPVEKMRG